MSAASLESFSALRAAADAAASLARFDTAMQRSPLRVPAARAFDLLDVAGSLALDNTPMDVAAVLCQPAARRDAAVRRLLDARMRCRDESAGALDMVQLQALGAGENAGRHGVRAHGLGRRERQTLLDAEQLPRGASRVGAALADWLDLIERGAGEVHPLILVATAHRRWLAIRPFTAGNLRLAPLLDELLLRAEGQLHGVKPPMARWLARSIPVYRERLLLGRDDEPGWASWWLDALARCAEDALARLEHWESLQRELALKDDGAGQRAGAGFLARVSAPVFDQGGALASSGLSRAATVRWLERRVDEGGLAVLQGTREKRFTNPAVVENLLDTLAGTCTPPVT